MSLLEALTSQTTASLSEMWMRMLEALTSQTMASLSEMWMQLLEALTPHTTALFSEMWEQLRLKIPSEPDIGETVTEKYVQSADNSS